eukprot:1265541-Rhodomonas_salina.1
MSRAQPARLTDSDLRSSESCPGMYSVRGAISAAISALHVTCRRYVTTGPRERRRDISTRYRIVSAPMSVSGIDRASGWWQSSEPRKKATQPTGLAAALMRRRS